MSPPEVTITLGRSGQVVKRKRTDTDGEQSFSYNSSVRKRFGTHGDASFSSHSKKQREVDDKEHVSRDRENGLHLDKNDLRHKLIQRRLYSERHVSASGHEQRGKVKREFSGAPAVARSSLSTHVLHHGPQSSRDRRFQVNPCREADGDLVYVEPSRNYFSTGTIDDFRRRSPTKPTYNSSRLLPPNYETEMPKTTLTRTIDPLGNERAYSNSLQGPPRSTVPSIPAHMMRLTEFKRAKPVALFSSPGGTMPRSLFTAEVPVTVVGLLNSLGLGKYAINFQVEEVDMPSLKQMGEKDLKDLGIPMGPRKKILLALTALSKRPLPRTR